MAQGVKITSDEFIKKLKSKYKNQITLVDDFKGTYNKSTFKCETCGNIWKTTGATILNSKYGCPICAKKSTIKITKDEIQKRIDDRHGVGKYKIISDVKTFNDKITVKCSNCGETWRVYIGHILNGNNCPNCIRVDINKKLDECGKGYIKAIEEYKGINNPIKFKCLNCGAEWIDKPSNVIRRNSCINNCKIKEENTENFIDELTKMYPDWEVIRGNKYYSCSDNITIKCKKCGYEVTNCISSLKQFIRVCRNCNPTGSNIEGIVDLELRKFVERDTYFRNYLFKDEKYGFNREIDFYFKDKKLGIDIDGMFYHSESIVGKNKQASKKEYFNKLGIKLIIIRSDEVISKVDIVNSRIKSLLKMSPKNIPARKLIFKDVNNSLKNMFLDKFHLQGRDNSPISFGLYTKSGKLVSVITFSKVRGIVQGKKDNKDTYELVRFASRTGVNVQGGFSKLIKNSIPILKELGCNKIKTFADRRWTGDTNNVYERNGFKLDHISEPNYVYFKNDYKVYSRIKFQKHKLSEILENYNPNLSEYSNMKNNGYDRYWDCGNLVYYMDI